MKKITLALLLILISTSALLAQDGNISSKQFIQNIADSLFYGKKGFDKTKAYAGAEIGIYYHDSVYYFSYGYADKENKIKPDTSTIFEIGSNTKLFTGLLLAAEMNKGTINSKTKIDEYVPVNKAIANKVCILDLATFTSGLPTLHDSESMADIERIDSVQPMAHVDNAYLLSVVNHTTSLKNYGQYEYSNYSYSLLGYILSDMAKKSYDHLLSKTILKPLNLVHTTITLDTDNIHLAKGYDGDDAAPYIQLSGMAPAGVLKSNVTDMMHFVRCQLGEPCAIEDEIKLSQEKFYTSDSMHLSTGLGWHIANMYDRDVYVMRGDTYGFSSMLAFDKKDKIGIVILTNTMNSDDMELSFGRIYRKIKENTAEYKKQFDKPAVKLNKELLSQYTGAYEVTPDFVMNVSLDGDSIYVQCTGQEKGLIVPVSENTFTAKKYGAEFEFVKSKDTRVDKIVLRQHGHVISGIKKS